LSTAYKNHVHRITRFGAGYAIDKVDFLEMLRLARNDAVNPVNIQKAWAVVGLAPFNPQLILQNYPYKDSQAIEKASFAAEQALLAAKHASQAAEHYEFSVRPCTPPEAVIRCQGPNGIREAIITPANTQQVRDLLEQALNGPDSQEIVQKVCKSAITALAECTIQESTNADLLAHAQRKEGKKRRRKGNCGLAMVAN